MLHRVGSSGLAILRAVAAHAALCLPYTSVPLVGTVTSVCCGAHPFDSRTFQSAEEYLEMCTSPRVSLSSLVLLAQF